MRQPVVPETVAQDLGLHLLRFAMMEQALPQETVVEFLASLGSALAELVGSLEQQADAIDAEANRHAALAVEHGLAVHRASLAWTEQAIARLTAHSPRA